MISVRAVVIASVGVLFAMVGAFTFGVYWGTTKSPSHGGQSVWLDIALMAGGLAVVVTVLAWSVWRAHADARKILVSLYNNMRAVAEQIRGVNSLRHDEYVTVLKEVFVNRDETRKGINWARDDVNNLSKAVGAAIEIIMRGAGEVPDDDDDDDTPTLITRGSRNDPRGRSNRPRRPDGAA